MKKQLPSRVEKSMEKLLATATEKGWDKDRIRAEAKFLAWTRAWSSKTEREVLEYIDHEYS